MLDFILDALIAVWDWIKHIVLVIINFIDNIVDFFRDPARLRKIQQNRDLIAVSIKNNLDSGNYNVVNCLFDQNTGEIVEEDSLRLSADNMDYRTKREFGNKDMIVLR